jgi:hypothetical protein
LTTLDLQITSSLHPLISPSSLSILVTFLQNVYVKYTSCHRGHVADNIQYFRDLYYSIVQHSKNLGELNGYVNVSVRMKLGGKNKFKRIFPKLNFATGNVKIGIVALTLT